MDDTAQGHMVGLAQCMEVLASPDYLLPDGSDRGARRRLLHERLQVPPTVQAVLAARIDRLPEREKLLLQTASADRRAVAGGTQRPAVIGIHIVKLLEIKSCSRFLSHSLVPAPIWPAVLRGDRSRTFCEPVSKPSKSPPSG